LRQHAQKGRNIHNAGTHVEDRVVAHLRLDAGDIWKLQELEACNVQRVCERVVCNRRIGQHAQAGRGEGRHAHIDGHGTYRLPEKLDTTCQKEMMLRTGGSGVSQAKQ
jgi:hypothetical protein